MTELPEPVFKGEHSQEATTGKHTVTVTASRPGETPGKEWSWTGEGFTVGEAVGQVVKKAFSDHASTELIGKK